MAFPTGLRAVVGVVLLILGVLLAASVLPFGALVLGLLVALGGIGLML